MEVSEHSLMIAGGARRVEFTVKEYAKLQGVTERTVHNWREKKAVMWRKTPGRGVRIIVEMK